MSWLPQRVVAIRPFHIAKDCVQTLSSRVQEVLPFNIPNILETTTMGVFNVRGVEGGFRKGE